MLFTSVPSTSNHTKLNEEFQKCTLSIDNDSASLVSYMMIRDLQIPVSLLA